MKNAIKNTISRRKKCFSSRGIDYRNSSNLNGGKNYCKEKEFNV